MEFVKRLISSNFLPHGTCYLRDPRIVWLHAISDSRITLAYYSVPLALVYVVRRRRALPFNWILWMFGVFILSCGTPHLMEVWTVCHETYLSYADKLFGGLHWMVINQRPFSNLARASMAVSQQ